MMSSWTKYGFFLCMVVYFGAAQDPCYYAEKINNLINYKVAEVSQILSQIIDELKYNEDWYAIGVLLGVPGSDLNKIQVESHNIMEKIVHLARYIINNCRYTPNLLIKEETNPLSEPSHKQAFLVVSDVKKLYFLGILLGVDKGELDSLFAKQIPPSQMKAEIVYIWLRNSYETRTYQELLNEVKVLQMDKCEMTVITRMYFMMSSVDWRVHQSDYAAAEADLKACAPVDWQLFGEYSDLPTHIFDEIKWKFTHERYDSDRCLIHTVYSWIKYHINHYKKCYFHQLLKYCKIAKMKGNVNLHRDHVLQCLHRSEQNVLTLPAALIEYIISKTTALIQSQFLNEMIASLSKTTTEISQTTALSQSQRKRITEIIEKQNELIAALNEEISKTTALIQSLRKWMTTALIQSLREQADGVTEKRLKRKRLGSSSSRSAAKLQKTETTADTLRPDLRAKFYSNQMLMQMHYKHFQLH